MQDDSKGRPTHLEGEKLFADATHVIVSIATKDHPHAFKVSLVLFDLPLHLWFVETLQKTTRFDAN